MADVKTDYPVKLTIDYPDRPLNRLSTFFRLFAIIPIFIVFALLTGTAAQWPSQIEGSCRAWHTYSYTVYVFFPLILMLLFRKKYPRWWFDWNLALARFAMRISAYLFLLGDEYPSTDEEQAVHLEMEYPNAQELSRWLPLIKWFLAIPHLIVLVFLAIAAIVSVIIAWFAILFTGRYPRSLFNFVVGFYRWNMRVNGYCFFLVTDKYPPFTLAE